MTCQPRWGCSSARHRRYEEILVTKWGPPTDCIPLTFFICLVMSFAVTDEPRRRFTCTAVLANLSASVDFVPRTWKVLSSRRTLQALAYLRTMILNRRGRPAAEEFQKGLSYFQQMIEDLHRDRITDMEKKRYKSK